MTQNKTHAKKKTTKTNSCSHSWVCEVLWEKIKGCTGGGHQGRVEAQFEDLLIALAERRSFPETRFFVERGRLGDTWSTESVAPAWTPFSVLTLPVKEPGRDVGGQFVDTQREKEDIRSDKKGFTGVCVTIVYPSMLCHAHSCSPTQDYPLHKISTNIHKTCNTNCKKQVLRIWACLTHLVIRIKQRESQ